MRQICPLLFVLALTGCVTTPPPLECPPDTQLLPHCPPLDAVADPWTDTVYEDRAWVDSRELPEDLIELAKTAEIPVQAARARILGPQHEDALMSLATKLRMIERAEHTIDFFYYIVHNDLVGMAMLGALCDAVERGVDVRIMIDATGSIGFPRSTLRAIVGCQDNAGFMRTADGAISTRRARIQAVVFNGLANFAASANRRSHDKLLVVDARYPEQAMVMTGGRNISLAYYGIDGNGQPDLDAYRDMEILLRDVPQDVTAQWSVGEVSELYASVLFTFRANHQLRPGRGRNAMLRYVKDRQLAAAELARLKAMPLMQPYLSQADAFLDSGYHEAEVLLAHELGNLTDRRVVSEALANQAQNSNSIMEVLRELDARDLPTDRVRIVSPYLFLARYKDEQGDVARDEAENLLGYVESRPDVVLEVVTNSVLTSDNIFTQAIIDMETAPRLLLDEPLGEAWLEAREMADPSPEFLASPQWQALVDHPRIRFYQTGRLDSARLIEGGKQYGKMHAKFLLDDQVGFIGTSNFDYRSRLYNNEMGFFFRSPELIADLNEDFDYLVSESYRWGTPEWLEMRRRNAAAKGLKGRATKGQRAIYKTLRATGLIWQF